MKSICSTRWRRRSGGWERPQTLDEIGAVFAAAFPDVAPAQRDKDIRTLAVTLERAGMVQTG